MSECLHQVSIRNPLYGQQYHMTNGVRDVSRPIQPGENTWDPFILVPCGKCLNCRTNRQNEWAFRMEQEYIAIQQIGGCAYFVTFTYYDECLTYGAEEATLVKRDVQLFHKRLRKAGLVFRYFTIGEYGGKLGRPHYHGMYFFRDYYTAEDVHELMFPHWNMCASERFTVDPFSIEDAKYIAKYSLKSPFIDSSGLQPPFSLSSRNPAIGASFLFGSAAKQVVVNQSYKVFDTGGTPYNIPRYYKQKLFTPLERYNIVQEFQYKKFCFGIQRYNNDISAYVDAEYKRMDELRLEEQYKVRQMAMDDIGKDCRVSLEDYLKIFDK